MYTCRTLVSKWMSRKRILLLIQSAPMGYLQNSLEPVTNVLFLLLEKSENCLGLIVGFFFCLFGENSVFYCNCEYFLSWIVIFFCNSEVSGAAKIDTECFIKRI